jgi:signal transduction histidine kinase/CheY-like chemotaxis protein
LVVTATATAGQVLRRLTRFQGLTMVVVILIASTSILSYRSAADRVRQTDATLYDLELLRGEVLSAETGMRGYVLTEKQSFLAPYREALPRIDAAGTRLRHELPVADRPALAAMLAVFDDWRAQFAEPVVKNLTVLGGDFIRAKLAEGQAKALIDRIRTDAADLAGGLRAESAHRQDVADRIGWVGLVATALGVVFIIGVGGEVRRRLARRIALPLAELADVTERFGSGELGARSRADGVAEVQRVAASFNAMAEHTETMVADLRALDRLKSEFVSVVSHELRTPLTSIRGSLGLLASGAMGELPADATEMLAIATSNTDRLVRLINDILDLERIEAGHEALDIHPVPVAALLADAASAVQGAADAAGVRLDVRPVDLLVDGDADRLVQALTNLLGNAVKFSDRGAEVVIEAEPRGAQVVLRVCDRGRGIPKEQLESVFERFHQVDASDAREKGGTGLGLAIVRSIAERHGGRVEVESVVGEGSCFSIVLPLSGRAPVTRRADVTADAGVVMLVEDDADLRKVVAALLARHGIDVATAETADEAIARCRQALPDVLILDVRLAEGDGYDVVQALRQDDRLRSLPTIVYTVVDLTPEQRDRLRLGETIFVAKGQRADEALEHEVLELLARVRT